MPFEIRFEGNTWRTEDLTLDEAIRIEQKTGRSWLRINPFAYGADAAEIIAMFLVRTGEDVESARTRVGKLSLKELVGCFNVVPDDLPDTFQDGVPKVEGDQETAGSSPAPDSSDGRPT